MQARAISENAIRKARFNLGDDGDGSHNNVARTIRTTRGKHMGGCTLGP